MTAGSMGSSTVVSVLPVNERATDKPAMPWDPKMGSSKNPSVGARTGVTNPMDIE